VTRPPCYEGLQNRISWLAGVPLIDSPVEIMGSVECGLRPPSGLAGVLHLKRRYCMMPLDSGGYFSS